MKTLVWKELRENAKWAFLAMMAFGIALCYALYQTRYGYQDYGYLDGITLCKKSFLIVTTFGCPAVGLFLGLVQILPELKRDRWAALLHRPVSRGLVFWGKAAGGIVLYVVATVIPFAFAVRLVATPGNFGAPFLPEMMKPGVADICTGVAYYFAALTMALQRGGWAGLRAFPLLAAVNVSYFVLSADLFYVAVEAVTAMTLALLFAAWGAIHNQDNLSARPLLGRLAFLGVVYYGACGLGNIALSLLDTVGPSPRSEDIRYELTKDGIPLRLRYINNVVVSVTDPDGKPLSDPKYKPDRVRNQIDYLNGLCSYVGDSHGWKPWRGKEFYRNSSTYLWANSPYQYPRMEQWFYLAKQRSLICYLPNLKIPVQRLDQRGFQPVSSPPVPFPPDVEQNIIDSDCYILSDPSGVRFAFLARREILDLALPSPGPVYGTGVAWASSGQGAVHVTGVALRGGVALYDEKGRQTGLLPYHQDMDRWGSLSLGVNATREKFYLWYQPSVWIDGKIRKTMPSYVEVMNAGGQVLNSYSLPPLPEFPRPVSPGTFLVRRLQSPAIFFGNMLYQKMAGELGSVRLKNALIWQFGPRWAVTKEIGIGSGSLSLLLAVVTFFWAHRAHFSRRRAWAWAVFVLLLNLPGFIAFRLAADWPRLVACTGCGKHRAVNTENCPSCNEGWPVPAQTGIEIFDRPSVPPTLPSV